MATSRSVPTRSVARLRAKQSMIAMKARMSATPRTV